jgi:hypothetical protein
LKAEGFTVQEGTEGEQLGMYIVTYEKGELEVQMASSSSSEDGKINILIPYEG